MYDTRNLMTMSGSDKLDGAFREYGELMFRTAYGVTGSREDAEDIVQTIFFRLLRRKTPPDLQPNPRAYLYRAAVNLSLDAIRSRKRHPIVSDVELSQVPAARSESNRDELLHRRLYDAIGKLKPQVAEILILRYVHNLSDREIASMLGVSRGTIALKLFRSRARLKKLLREAEGDPS